MTLFIEVTVYLNLKAKLWMTLGQFYEIPITLFAARNLPVQVNEANICLRTHNPKRRSRNVFVLTPSPLIWKIGYSQNVVTASSQYGRT